MHLLRFHLIAVISALAVLAGAVDSHAQTSRKPRELAPGVMTVIAPEPTAKEIGSGPLPYVEIVTGLKELEYTPNFAAKSDTIYERAKQVTFHRDIWCLEFSFKPMRLVEVEVPQPNGTVEKKLVWYMVYRVKNVGKDLKAVPVALGGGQIFKAEPGAGSERRFFPHFVLQSHDQQAGEKSYLDRVIPAAAPLIAAREKPDQMRTSLLNTIEMSQTPILVSDERTDRSVWGFVTWEDVDPRIDYFSVNIRGLTNAFEFADRPGGFKPGDPPGTGRVFRYKTLQLLFWRPGDSLFQHEGEFRYGVPVDIDPEVQKSLMSIYKLEQRVDYRWVYR